MGFPSDMHDKDYRHGLIDAQIEIDLPFQIRALRKQRDLTQPQLADLAGMKQSRISKMEKVGGARFTLETLRRLAKALDVAVLVRFAPFGELVKWSNEFDPDSFAVPNFDAECQAIEERRSRIRWSGSRKHCIKRRRSTAIPRTPNRTERAHSPKPMAAGGERTYGLEPSGSNSNSPSIAFVLSGNECTRYAGGLGG
jgi:transcriptional regulator with XRE-family HTH domain